MLKKLLALFSTASLFSMCGALHAKEYNLVFLPAPYCHQAGIEAKTGKNTSLGVIGRFNCISERPTYGNSDENVQSYFSRVLVPFKYSFNGAFTNGAFAQGLVGIENTEFESGIGTTAEVTFVNLAVHGGYQWYFSNGFNISLLAGVAHLKVVDSDKVVSVSEQDSVASFLDKNTKTNTHGGFGVLVGWLF